MSQMLDFKEKLLETGLFAKTSRSGWYRVQTCPYCGDCKKHFYVRIDLEDPESPVGFNCFKCHEKGLLNHVFLDFYELDIKLVKGKHRRRIDTEGVSVVVPDLLPADCDVSSISEYIRSRIGVIPTRDDLVAFQYIGDPRRYASEFLSDDKPDAYFSSRHWFRAVNGMMLGRTCRDTNNSTRHIDRWAKYTGNVKLRDIGVYTIKKLFDLHKPIDAYIVEGVFDCIGLYYYYPDANAIFIGCLGSDYNIGIQHLLNRGIFGDTVSIKIIKDNDVSNVSIDKRKASFFKTVSVFRNVLEKDTGVPKDRIELEKSI